MDVQAVPAILAADIAPSAISLLSISPASLATKALACRPSSKSASSPERFILDAEMAAAAEISTLTMVPSAILAEVTALLASLAVLMAALAISAAFTWPLTIDRLLTEFGVTSAAPAAGVSTSASRIANRIAVAELGFQLDMITSLC